MPGRGGSPRVEVQVSCRILIPPGTAQVPKAVLFQERPHLSTGLRVRK
jgi:hypothetical protein